MLSLVGVAPVLALDPARKAGDYSLQGWLTDHGLPSNKIRDIVQTRDGCLWLATAQGLARFDGHAFTVFNEQSHPSLRGNEFFCVVEASDGSLWFGGEHGVFRWRDGRFEQFTTEHGLANNYVRALELMRDGTVVACTRKGYSFIRDGRVTTPGGIWKEIKGVCRSFLERGDGSMLLGTSTGLWRIAGERIERLSGSAMLQGNSFFSLLETPDGTVWIAYSGGVHCLKPDGSSENYGAAEGLVDPNVSDLQRDRDGNVWIAASANLYRVTEGRLEVTNYADSFNGAPLRRMHEDREGALWITSLTGLFRLKDKIGTRAISPPAPEKVQFKIRLAPLDDDWVEVGGQRDVRYGRLPGGDYTFRVKAYNNDGLWNEGGATLAFSVRPFFYQTRWFIGLAGLCFVVTVTGLIWLNVRCARRQMGVLGKVVDDRTRELRVAKESAETAVLAKNDSIAALERAQNQLTEASALLEALLDNTPDFIYFKDLESRFVRFSHAVMKRFNLKTPASLIGLTDADVFSVEHAAPALRDEQEIIRTGVPIIGKLEREAHTDGKVTWALTTKMAWRDGTGAIIGTFGVSKDVTAWKETEMKLAETHRELLATSRQAGMAEVATGVLHNVGNVLNSVNVSATLVLDRVQGSKTGNVRKLGLLLEEQSADLGHFITSDPRGRRIPSYLATLSHELEHDQQAITEELGNLRKNIEHIKDIVAMQQSYAKVSGIVESIAVTELVEDALRMNASALVRHGLEVVRDYVDQPIATTERHKVLQILVNLIRNAKYACDDSARADKRLIIRISAHDEHVRIAVVDNGIGIPRENLTRIFAHGFTTRREGHGFGLHSGALVARELGGTLTAHSDGPETGATFTLELPLHPKTPSSL